MYKHIPKWFYEYSKIFQNIIKYIEKIPKSFKIFHLKYL